MSGTRGPLSNPNAVRRNKKAPGTHLPAEGFTGAIPEWPLKDCSDEESDRWDCLWRIPQAAAWIRMHIEFTVARYVRLSLVVEDETRNNYATSQTLNTVTQLEDRLGLNPQALKRLEWEIVEDELDTVRSSAPANVAARRSRLKAVDPA
jgi:hypothetical protein